MAENQDRQDQQDQNQYNDEDMDQDTRGQKGGTSQQNYRESSDMESERDPAERDDEMDEEISGW